MSSSQKGVLWWAAHHRDAPQVLRPGGRRPLGRCATASSGRTSDGSSRASARRPTSRASRTWRSTPSSSGSTAGGASRRRLLGVALFLVGRLVRARLGALRVDRAALARHLHHQLADAHVRLAPVPDDRQQPQQRRSSPPSRWARAGTTTTTTTSAPRARASSGGRFDVTYYVLRVLGGAGPRVGSARAAGRGRRGRARGAGRGARADATGRPARVTVATASFAGPTALH